MSSARARRDNEREQARDASLLHSQLELSGRIKQRAQRSAGKHGIERACKNLPNALVAKITRRVRERESNFHFSRAGHREIAGTRSHPRVYIAVYVVGLMGSGDWMSFARAGGSM